MYSQAQQLRPLLPRSGEVLYDEATSSGVQQSPAADDVPPPPPRVLNRNRNARKSQEEWERIKGPFLELYVYQDPPLTLKDSMQALETRYGFFATYVLFSRFLFYG